VCGLLKIVTSPIKKAILTNEREIICLRSYQKIHSPMSKYFIINLRKVNQRQTSSIVYVDIEDKENRISEDV